MNGEEAPLALTHLYFIFPPSARKLTAYTAKPSLEAALGPHCFQPKVPRPQHGKYRKVGFVKSKGPTHPPSQAVCLLTAGWWAGRGPVRNYSTQFLVVVVSQGSSLDTFYSAWVQLLHAEDGFAHLLQRAGHKLNAQWYTVWPQVQNLHFFWNCIFKIVQICSKCWFILNSLTLNVQVCICTQNTLTEVPLTFISTLNCMSFACELWKWFWSSRK